MKSTRYKVTDVAIGTSELFDTISGAKKHIENWGIENDYHVGKVDIDSNTILWHVGTFKNPIIQFEKVLLTHDKKYI